MKICVIRHGKALTQEEVSVTTDAKRPLSQEGRKDIVSLGRRLKAKGARLEIIFSSPMLRAQQTARTLSRILNPKSGVKELTALNGQKSASEVWHAIEEATANQYKEIALVGHQPQLGELISWLVNDQPPDLKPGTTVALQLISQKAAQILWIENPS